LIVAPRIRPCALLAFFYSQIRTYFPKRLELSLRTVLAFPKASKIGLHIRIRSSIAPRCRIAALLRIEALKLVLLPPLTYVRKFIAYFAFSVFPAPLSPDITIAWFLCC
jgi:hypothetical protein